MKDLALIVVSVGLAALLARTWGHRRLLHQVREQLEVREILPNNWHQQRQALDELAAADMARYIRSRNPAYPLHRMMQRNFALNFLGFSLFAVAQYDHLPGPEQAWDVASRIGIGIVALVTTVNLIVLVSRRKQISEEIQRSASKS